jgi:hypothetical protein
VYGCTSSLFAQKIPKSESSNRVILHKADTLYTFFAFINPPVRKKTSLNDSKVYYWYQSDNIRRTVGGQSDANKEGVKYIQLFAVDHAIDLIEDDLDLKKKDISNLVIARRLIEYRINDA